MEKILVSACLLGADCKYSGGNNRNEALCRAAAGGRVCLIPVCPEQLGGLPTPRPPCERRGAQVLDCEGADRTAAFARGARQTLALAQLLGCRTAILKQRSPSCGSREIYDGSFGGRVIPGEGLTAALLREHGLTVLSEEDAEAFLGTTAK